MEQSKAAQHIVDSFTSHVGGASRDVEQTKRTAHSSLGQCAQLVCVANLRLRHKLLHSQQFVAVGVPELSQIQVVAHVIFRGLII